MFIFYFSLNYHIFFIKFNNNNNTSWLFCWLVLEPFCAIFRLLVKPANKLTNKL